VLLRGLDRGSYALYAVSSHQGGRDDLEAAFTGFTPFDISNKNIEVAVPLQPISVVEGELTVPEGVAVPRVTPTISTRPLGLLNGAEALDETFLVWKDDRHFRLGVSPYSQRLNISPFAEAHYVREIRYGGAPLRDRVLPISQSGPQKLEIVLADLKSGITGSVKAGSNLVANATVYLIPDGGRLEDLSSAPRFNTATNAQGNFSRSVAPGEYRVVAVTREGLDRMNQPGVFERAVSLAQKVTVRAGSMQSVEVLLVDPR
jgi:hypothetical protein